MRLFSHPLGAIALTGLCSALLATGCASGSGSASGDATAAATAEATAAGAATSSTAAAIPAGAGKTDAPTTLPVYPGATFVRENDFATTKSINRTYSTADSLETVGAWYKNQLPKYNETDNSKAASFPTIAFIKYGKGTASWQATISKGEGTSIVLAVSK